MTQRDTSSSITLYHKGVDLILHCFLTHEEAKKVLKYYHSGACGNDIFGLEMTYKILRVGCL